MLSSPSNTLKYLSTLNKRIDRVGYLADRPMLTVRLFPTQELSALRSKSRTRKPEMPHPPPRFFHAAQKFTALSKSGDFDRSESCLPAERPRRIWGDGKYKTNKYRALQIASQAAVSPTFQGRTSVHLIIKGIVLHLGGGALDDAFTRGRASVVSPSPTPCRKLSPSSPARTRDPTTPFDTKESSALNSQGADE